MDRFRTTTIWDDITTSESRDLEIHSSLSWVWTGVAFLLFVAFSCCNPLSRRKLFECFEKYFNRVRCSCRCRICRCHCDTCKRTVERCWSTVKSKFIQCKERICRTTETGNVETPSSVTTPPVTLSQLSVQIDEDSTNSRRNEGVSTMTLSPPPSYDSIISDPSLPPPSYEEVMRWYSKANHHNSHVLSYIGNECKLNGIAKDISFFWIPDLIHTSPISSSTFVLRTRMSQIVLIRCV